MNPIVALVEAGALSRSLAFAAEAAKPIHSRLTAAARSPMSRAIAMIRKEFMVEGRVPTYEEARNVYRRAARNYNATQREISRQQSQIDAGIPPTPPGRRGTASDVSRSYRTRVFVESPRTGRGYWTTVIVNGRSTMTASELCNEAQRAIASGEHVTPRAKRERARSNWQVTDCQILGWD